MIFGYPDEASVLPGGELVLRVSTDAPLFRVDLYRAGADLTLMSSSAWLPGRDVPHHLPHQDWGRPGRGRRGERCSPWARYRCPVPAHWPSGTYIAMLVEGDGDGTERRAPDPRTPDGRSAKALFVVRAPAPGSASILYKIPLLTYHAYNEVTPRRGDPPRSWCLYTLPGPAAVPSPVPQAVSLRRPGGGTGGTPWDIFNVDPFDPTPRQTFVHWDGPFIGWLERAGYRVDYCTDLDLHRDDGPALLERYRLLLSAGHDEYWSAAMRRHVEDFVHGGGNVAFFGGNTCWWRVQFDDECSFRRVGNWFEVSPENTLTGVSFRNGGERDGDRHPVPVGYRVQHAGHWVYAGTGLRDGDVFGDRPGEYLVGYECDGADFDRRELRRGGPVRPSCADGTPESFVILGIGDAGPSGWGLGNKAATMGVHTGHRGGHARGGTVFTAATTDWPRVLAQGTVPAVRRITRTVLDRLGR